VTRRHRSAALAVTALAVTALAASTITGCATEVDPEIAAESTGVPSTAEFAAVGTTAELFDQLVAEAGSLSEAIVANRSQRTIVGRIDTLWEAARPSVEREAPDSLAEFDRTIALMHIGVDRRRPADADKAYTNLVILLAALPATSPYPAVRSVTVG
jgi:hypothetical protein